MAPPQVHSEGLKTTFTGTKRECEGVLIHRFTGIKYGSVPARFEAPRLVDRYGRDVDASVYRPRCPQAAIDCRHLLRIPEDYEIDTEAENEFECLNLDITCPPSSPAMRGKLPVVVWIHGGSQVVTFCSASSGICDPTRLVADSVNSSQPVVFVSLNYRLNIFGFGDGKEMNLALKDQRVGIDWVRRNIAVFGGDPDNITLAGESAGAVYAHAHLITGPPVKRAILASGSLYLSSPLPVEKGNSLVKALESKVWGLGGSSLRDAPTAVLTQALRECNVNTMWLQEDPELENWENRPEQVDEVMIGDTEFESVIWRNGIETLDSKTITESFESAHPQWGPKLRKAYQIAPDRPTPSKLGALDFVNDARFALPVEMIADKLSSKPVYKYVVDQPNPWQPSSRAHHAVDLLFLFGGLDLSSNPPAERVGWEMRRRWVMFVNGDSPWSVERRFAYGPLGECQEITEGGFAARRRVEHIKMLRKAAREVYMPIVAALTAGKISLLN